MANRQSLWQRFLGGAVNAALPGSPYSRYSGYNPTLTRNSIISGVAGQLIPGGGTIAQTILNRTGSGQAALAGQQGIAGLMQQTNAGYGDMGNFDSSGINPEFAQVQPVDFSQFDPNTMQPLQQPAQQQDQSQQPPTSLAGLMATGGRDSRSGHSAGSHTLAEGQAAQDMVGDWQTANWLNMRAPTFGNTYSRRS